LTGVFVIAISDGNAPLERLGRFGSRANRTTSRQSEYEQRTIRGVERLSPWNDFVQSGHEEADAHESYVRLVYHGTTFNYC